MARQKLTLRNLIPVTWSGRPQVASFQWDQEGHRLYNYRPDTPVLECVLCTAGNCIAIDVIGGEMYTIRQT